MFFSPCLLRESLPWALERRPDHTLQSASLELWSSWKQRWLDSLAKYEEEVEEPVGGEAVDVDQVADEARTKSCLLPANHGIQGWC